MGRDEEFHLLLPWPDRHSALEDFMIFSSGLRHTHHNHSLEIACAYPRSRRTVRIEVGIVEGGWLEAEGLGKR